MKFHMSYSKLKEVAFSDSKKVYHFYKHGLFIGTGIESVEPYYEEAGIKFNFNGGNFHIWKDNRITECRRPSNLLVECEICFSLNNEHDEHIGFLYIPKEK